MNPFGYVFGIASIVLPLLAFWLQNPVTAGRKAAHFGSWLRGVFPGLEAKLTETAQGSTVVR
jgi:hypothetical protein